MSKNPYASAIGSIMYAMVCTRPDVSFALSACSTYQSDPGLVHWAAVKNILKYLRRTKELFLVYGGDEELLAKGYTDASFMTDHDDFKSQSGYVVTLNGGAVSWKSFRWRRNTLRLQKRQRRASGLGTSSSSLMSSRVLKTHWSYTVITLAQWLKQRSQGLIRNPNMSTASTILFVISSKTGT